jgi:hypothetical protein
MYNKRVFFMWGYYSKKKRIVQFVLIKKNIAESSGIFGILDTSTPTTYGAEDERDLQLFDIGHARLL